MQPTTDATRDAGLRRVEFVAGVLDEAIRIPGTDLRIGMDPIVGLLPGVGDLVGGAASLYIILEAARQGAPASVLVRMAANVAIDTLVGAIPVLGDLFDFGWKSNTRNARLLARHLKEPAGTRRASTALVVGVLAGLLAIVIGVSLVVVFALRKLFG